MVYTYDTILFSLKKEGNSVTTWMNLENIVLSERRQKMAKKKAIFCEITKGQTVHDSTHMKWDREFFTQDT